MFWPLELSIVAVPSTSMPRVVAVRRAALAPVGADHAAGDGDDRAAADLDPRTVAAVPSGQRELLDGARERALEVEAVKGRAGRAAVDLNRRAGAEPGAVDRDGLGDLGQGRRGLDQVRAGGEGDRAATQRIGCGDRVPQRTGGGAAAVVRIGLGVDLPRPGKRLRHQDHSKARHNGRGCNTCREPRSAPHRTRPSLHLPLAPYGRGGLFASDAKAVVTREEDGFRNGTDRSARPRRRRDCRPGAGAPDEGGPAGSPRRCAQAQRPRRERVDRDEEDTRPQLLDRLSRLPPEAVRPRRRRRRRDRLEARRARARQRGTGAEDGEDAAARLGAHGAQAAGAPLSEAQREPRASRPASGSPTSRASRSPTSPHSAASTAA